MNSNELLGDFKNCYIGYSKNQLIREKSSSGGIVTSLLIHALEKKLVDEVICIGYKKDDPTKSEIRKCKSKEDILSCIGSKYIKTTFLDIKDKIDPNKNTAIVGLPCTIATIRKLKEIGKYSNIKLMLGVFCGWCPSYDMTRYFIKKSKQRIDNIKEIDYRGGKFPGGFTIFTKDNKTIHFKKHHYDFPNIMFGDKSCQGCKFYTAEHSDISVGDTWIKGKEHYSTIITRTDIGNKLIKSALDKEEIHIEEINYKEIIKYHWHNIKHKKLGDSFLFSYITKLLNNKLAPKVIPFKLMNIISYLRRAVK